jgi:hypothetical protein
MSYNIILKNSLGKIDNMTTSHKNHLGKCEENLWKTPMGKIQSSIGISGKTP